VTRFLGLSFKIFGKKGSKFVNVGTNYKLSDIHSAVGLAQMRKIEKIIKKKDTTS